MDISQKLYIDQIDSFELGAVLMHEFNSQGNDSRKDSEQKHVVVYGNEELIVTYKSKSSRIRKIVAGKNLTKEKEDKLATLVKKFLVNKEGDTKYPFIYIFKSSSDEFRFKYKDKFQIFSVPKELPRPDMEMGDHPLILQYQYIASGLTWLDSIRRQKLINEISTLLTALSSTVLTFSIYNALKYSKNVWVLPSIERTIEDNTPLRSKYCPMGYYSDFIVTDSDFFKLDFECFSFTNELLKQNLDLYFTLSEEEKEKIIRGCMWYEKAVLSNSITDRFLNYVIMIESFLPQGKRCKKEDGGCGGYIPSGEKKCTKCGQYEGEIGKKFKEFLAEYAGINEASYISSIYATRSQIAHSAISIGGEGQNFHVGIIPQLNNEREMTYNLGKICSMIIRKLIFNMCNKKYNC
jgi:hypothetical protein